MDQKSLEMLEFPRVREILASFTSFASSRELALDLQPHSDVNVVSLALKQSSEARRLFSVRPGFAIGQMPDERHAVRLAAAGKVLETSELAGIQQTVAVSRQLRAALSRLSEEVSSLWAMASDIADLASLEKEISAAIAPGGDVLDSASERLGLIRRRLRDTRRELLGRLHSFIASDKGKKVLQEPIVTEREGRFVVPVKIEFRKEIKGIVHDMSNTGQTLFVEPWMTVETGNELRQRLIEEQQEVERVLAALSNSVGQVATSILRNIDLVSQIDLALAKARYAEQASAIEASISSCDGAWGDGAIKLVEARHPLLKGKVVPLSVEIGSGHRVLVISGPNTGGKTVALKTIGLLALMTQAGMPVPAKEGTRLPLFDSVFADLGDEQSIENTLSTFSWHIGNIVRIVERSTPHSLVLLDELGTSTDPSEGTALARAILYHFRDQGAACVATTHYTDIKIAAQTSPGLLNASLDFDPETLTPTYHLTVGVPGASNAFAIASRLGLSGKIIDAAVQLRSGSAAELEAVLHGMVVEKQKTAALRARLEAMERQADMQRKSFEAELAERRQKAEDEQAAMLRELAVETVGLSRQIRIASTELRKNLSKPAIHRAKQVMASLNAKLQETQTAPKEDATPARTPISVGDKVRLEEVGVCGTVDRVLDKENEIEVIVGKARIRLNASEVERSAETEEHVPQLAFVKRATRAGAAALELDLRGKRADEVEPVLDSYLNEAFLSHLAEVRIIHGTGTGVVRQIVRDMLGVHPLVKSFRTGGSVEGGNGVTMVSLSHGK
ncbi:MAG: endonuclease MutS2 [Chloroflexi bacterium]|nr:endonuclease MutS2 [Chloroflexota bacterium]